MEALGGTGAFRESDDRGLESSFDQLARELSAKSRVCPPPRPRPASAHDVHHSSAPASDDLTPRRRPHSPGPVRCSVGDIHQRCRLCVLGGLAGFLRCRRSAPPWRFLLSVARTSATEEGDSDSTHAHWRLSWWALSPEQEGGPFEAPPGPSREQGWGAEEPSRPSVRSRGSAPAQPPPGCRRARCARASSLGSGGAEL